MSTYDVLNIDKQLAAGLFTLSTVQGRTVAVSYHVEGGETFELAGSVSLSMQTLTSERPLFLCNNPFEWFPDHLPDHGCSA